MAPSVKSDPPERRSVRIERWLTGLIAAAIVLVFLVQARFFLIPLAIAVLIFSFTSAAIDWLARIRLGSVAIPGWLASVGAVASIAALILMLVGFVSAQVDTALATALSYNDRAQEAISGLFVLMDSEIAQSVLAAFRDIDFGAYLRSLAGSAGNLLVASTLVILYVGFLFAERPWFDDKLAMLFPEPRRARHVRKVVDSISRTVHRYLLVKTLVSAVTGIVVYLVLLAFGLDFAESLAALTFILNFIPNVGSIMATILPGVVAVVQFDDWSSVLFLLATVGTIQFAFGNILDPMMMGRTLRLSSLAIILSLTFWGAIWGIVGMFLAVPIMVMVMIVCAHIPALRPLAILLSRDGTPPTEPDDGSGE